MQPFILTLQTTAASWAQQVISFDIPVPDIALIGAPALLICAVWASAQARVARAQQQLAAYQAELLTMNRRTQQARGELRRAEQLIERERQKRRREANRAVARPQRKRALVDMRSSALPDRARTPLDRD